MSSFYQSVISIISKAKEKRQAEEITLILAWFINLFKKKSHVFGEIDAEVIRDIIKNCSFETKKPDDIIIHQGDVGDCFYINLRGKVSIYLNHTKHEHDDLNESFEEGDLSNRSESRTHSPPSSEEKSKRVRKNLGNFVTSLGAGEGFGEIALVSSDTRTASIIADEVTDLMVVNKSLYARCLQAPAQRKLNEKQKFINSSPFFGNWSPKMKKLLSLCLERDVIPYDSYLGKQGEIADKIYFIISGEAKVTVNPTSHSMQYPRMYPLKLPENAEKEIISSWIDEKNALLNNGKITSSFTRINSGKVNSNSQIIKRRNETFAEAEQRLKTKKIEIGILGAGEIAGLSEIIFELPTYMESTRCIEDCDVFYIYKRSYERLIAKRNPMCISKMKDYIFMKLMSRNSRLKHTIPVDLYRSLYYNIELSRKKRSINLVKVKPVNPLDIPPKGPIIKLDTKPKLAAYNRMSRRNSQVKHEDIPIKDHWIVESLTRIDNPNESFELDNNKLVKPQQKTSLIDSGHESDSHDTHSPSISDISKNYESQELDILEKRIKRWYRDVGCKKVNVTKLNRIDIDKIKSDVKVGGNIFIRKSNLNESNKTSRLRTGSGFSDSSSSENTGSDAETDFVSNSLKMLNSLKINYLNSTENNHSNDTKNQRYNTQSNIQKKSTFN